MVPQVCLLNSVNKVKEELKGILDEYIDVKTYYKFS